MPIPFLIVWGYRDSFSPLGWTARKCPRCQKVQPFQAYKRTRAHHIYFIHTRDEEIGTVVACDFCDSNYGLKKSEAVHLDPRWKRHHGLEALAKTTNPDLLPLPPRALPSEQELFALLESTNEKGNVFSKNISQPFLQGAMVSASTLGLLYAALRLISYLYSYPPAFGYGVLEIIIGSSLGGIIWAIAGGRRKAHEIMIETLRRAMRKQRLDTTTLRSALSRHPRRLGRVRRILAGIP